MSVSIVELASYPPERPRVTDSQTSSQKRIEPATRASQNKRRDLKVGRYYLERRISGGGSGSVYRAITEDGQVVAIKLLSLAAAKNDIRLLRFYQEGRTLLQVSHPNLVRAIEIGEDAGQHYLAMEYIEGQTLAERVMKQGKLKEATALRVAIAIARGLQAAHSQNVIHRDVSPKNILVGKRGEVKLGDFEFSKQPEMDLDLTIQGTGLGTPDFMSPEQFRKAKDVDARTDVYSLGATLYVMLTARLPFPGKTLTDKWLAKSKNHYLPPEALNRSLCRGTVTLVKKAMSADPRKRPASVREFADFAERCLESLEFQNSQNRRAVSQNTRKWQVMFISERGETQVVRATEDQVKRLLDAGKIGGDARVALAGSKRYARLSEAPEFQHLFGNSSLANAIHRTNRNVLSRGNRILGKLGRLFLRLGQRMSGSH